MNKVLSIIKTTLVWLVVLLAVFMMIFTIISVTTFDRNDRDIFGYRAYIVKTDSMAATDFNAGDLILTKEVDPYSLQPGDIITFISQDPDSYNEVITHKIREKTRDAEGNLAFVTYGTTTDTNDETLVTAPYILGQYQFAIPFMGTFFNFLKTPQGYFICIFTPFMLLIIQQAVKSVRLFVRYKKEQMEEMEAEKKRIEDERAQNAKMMEELLALKAQLEAQTPKTPDTPVEGGGTEDAET